MSRPRLLCGRRMQPAVAPRPHGYDLDGLQLRPWRRTDYPAWLAIECDRVTRLMLDWPERTLEQQLIHLADRTRHDRLEQRDDFLALAVIDGSDIVGDVSAHLREVRPEHRSFELGWITAPAHRDQGYATRAAAALRDLLFRDHGAQWVYAVILDCNEASERVALRLGMHRTLTAWSISREEWLGLERTA